jgi:hypothetical protein
MTGTDVKISWPAACLNNRERLIDLNCQTAVGLALVIRLLVTPIDILIFYFWRQFNKILAVCIIYVELSDSE